MTENQTVPFSFLSPGQAGEYLGYGKKSTWYVLKMLRKAGVPITKLGKRKILIAKKDIDKYIQEKTLIQDRNGKPRPAIEVEKERKLAEMRKRKYG